MKFPKSKAGINAIRKRFGPTIINARRGVWKVMPRILIPTVCSVAFSLIAFVRTDATLSGPNNYAKGSSHRPPQAAVLAPLAGGTADLDETTIAVGARILHPEVRTGAWEFRASRDRTADLEVQVIEDVAPDTPSLVNLIGTIRSVEVDTDVRVAGQTTRAFWRSGQSTAAFQWRHDRLRIHQKASDGFLPIDLDLQFDPRQDRWTGYFHDPSFSGRVALMRPNQREAGSPVGAWGVDGNCLHIAMGDDGRLIAWSDYTFFTYPTPSPNAPQPQQPSGRQQSYGEFEGDPMEKRSGAVWTFRIGNMLGGNTYTGSLGADGTTFSGTFVHDGNGISPRDNPHPVYPFTLHRGTGTSCSDAKVEG